MLGGQLANRGGALLLSVLAARALGADTFGEFALFTNLALFGAAFALPGVDASLIRTRGASLADVLRLKMLVAGVAFPLMVVVSVSLLDYSVPLTLLAILSGYLQGFSETAENLLVVYRREGIRALVQAVPSLASVAIVAVLWYLVEDVRVLLVAMVVVCGRDASRFLAGVVSAARHRIPVGPQHDALTFLALTTVLGYVYSRADVLILGQFGTTEQVATYATAYMVVLAGQNLPAAIAPLLLRSMVDHSSTVRLIVSTQALIGVAIAVVTWFCAELIMVGVFGPDFSESTAVLRILCLAFPFLFMNSALLRYFLSRGRDRQLLLLLAATTGISVVTCIVFVNRAGPAGAAWSTVVAEALFAVLMLSVTGFRRRSS